MKKDIKDQKPDASGEGKAPPELRRQTNESRQAPKYVRSTSQIERKVVSINGDKFKWMEEKLYWAAGADVDALRKAGHEDRVRYQGLGGMVFATSLLSFVTSSYALYVLLRAKTHFASTSLDFKALLISIILGFGWSVMIFTLDRFMVSSCTTEISGGKKSYKTTLLQVVPRLMLAALIALTMSKPIEVKLMESELDRAVAEQQTRYIEQQSRIATADLQRQKEVLERRRAESGEAIRNMSLEMSGLEELVNAQRKSVDEEATGTSGSRRRGLGEVYLAKLRTLDSLTEDLRLKRESITPEIARLQSTMQDMDRLILDLESRRVGMIEKIKANAIHLDGLMTRILLAHQISPLTSLLLVLLFMALEIAPLLFKLTLPNGTYELIQNKERRALRNKNNIIPITSIDPFTKEYRVAHRDVDNEIIEAAQLTILPERKEDKDADHLKKIEELASRLYETEEENKEHQRERNSLSEQLKKTEELYKQALHAIAMLNLKTGSPQPQTTGLFERHSSWNPTAWRFGAKT